MNKTAAEMALTLVIVAVIALIVLVVVIFIFGNKANMFSKGTSDCLSLSGTCEDKNCLLLTPPRSALPGECSVPENTPAKYCCSAIVR